jgi:hypothetical protein
MRERGQDVRIPTDVAADLVAGHLHTLWNQVVNDEDMRGCCKRCCAPCHALSELLDMGLLDDLYEVYLSYSGGRDSDVWDDEKGEIDRAWFANAWRDDLGCHERGTNA